MACAFVSALDDVQLGGRLARAEQICVCVTHTTHRKRESRDTPAGAHSSAVTHTSTAFSTQPRRHTQRHGSRNTMAHPQTTKRHTRCHQMCTTHRHYPACDHRARLRCACVWLVARRSALVVAHGLYRGSLLHRTPRDRPAARHTYTHACPAMLPAFRRRVAYARTHRHRLSTTAAHSRPSRPRRQRCRPYASRAPHSRRRAAPRSPPFVPSSPLLPGYARRPPHHP